MTTSGEVEELGEGRFTSGMRVQRLLLLHKLQELPRAAQILYSGHQSWHLRSPLYSLCMWMCTCNVEALWIRRER